MAGGVAAGRLSSALSRPALAALEATLARFTPRTRHPGPGPAPGGRSAGVGAPAARGPPRRPAPPPPRPRGRDGVRERRMEELVVAADVVTAAVAGTETYDV